MKVLSRCDAVRLADGILAIALIFLMGGLGDWFAVKLPSVNKWLLYMAALGIGVFLLILADRFLRYYIFRQRQE